MSHLLWTQKQDVGPSARTSSAMAFDSTKNRTLLFGGTVGSTGSLTGTATGIGLAAGSAVADGFGTASAFFPFPPLGNPIAAAPAITATAPTPIQSHGVPPFEDDFAGVEIASLRLEVGLVG